MSATADTLTPMAAHSWREFLAWPHDSGLSELLEADRDDLWFGTKTLKKRVADSPDIGGLLLWDETHDHEGGTLLMLSGQTAGDENWVIRNAQWLVSCGAVYAASRVGTGFKAGADFAFSVEGSRFLCWLLWNDRKVSSLESHEQMLAALGRQA